LRAYCLLPIIFSATCFPVILVSSSICRPINYVALYVLVPKQATILLLSRPIESSLLQLPALYTMIHSRMYYPQSILRSTRTHTYIYLRHHPTNHPYRPSVRDPTIDLLNSIPANNGIGCHFGLSLTRYARVSAARRCTGHVPLHLPRPLTAQRRKRRRHSSSPHNCSPWRCSELRWTPERVSVDSC